MESNAVRLSGAPLIFSRGKGGEGRQRDVIVTTHRHREDITVTPRHVHEQSTAPARSDTGLAKAHAESPGPQSCVGHPRVANVARMPTASLARRLGHRRCQPLPVRHSSSHRARRSLWVGPRRTGIGRAVDRGGQIFGVGTERRFTVNDQRKPTCGDFWTAHTPGS